MTHRFGSWEEPDDDPADYPPWEDDGEADYEAECDALDQLARVADLIEAEQADDLGAYFDHVEQAWLVDRFEPCDCRPGDYGYDYDECAGGCPDCGNSGWVLA